MLLSIAICTHNPRRDFFTRTLDSLRMQTLPHEQWELLVIDNASTVSIPAAEDLDWHPRARVIREDKIGLTMARLRAIQEFSGDLLLFVDDDNVLAGDYAEKAIRIAQEKPFLGCFGAGRLIPEFEEPPTREAEPYIGYLGLRNIDRELWSNETTSEGGSTPYGAGILLRRDVAEFYLQKCMGDETRCQLDRSGNNLNSFGDFEFSCVACEMGYGKGIFPDLVITHLIDRKRVQLDYLIRFTEGFDFSKALFNHLHGLKIDLPQRKPSIGSILSAFARCRLYDFFNEGRRWWKFSHLSPFEQAIRLARNEGLRRAQEYFASNKPNAII